MSYFDVDKDKVVFSSLQSRNISSLPQASIVEEGGIEETTKDLNMLVNNKESQFQIMMKDSWLEKQCMDGYQFNQTPSLCPRTFDGWTCWNETNAGSVAYNPCPSFVLGFDSSNLLIHGVEYGLFCHSLLPPQMPKEVSMHGLRKQKEQSNCLSNTSEMDNSDESLHSSMEGTPVILSREGSRIRIVDEETGEIFFRKRSKSRSKYRKRDPIFIPRLSSVHKMEADSNNNENFELDSFSKTVLGVKGRRHILENPEAYEEDNNNCENPFVLDDIEHADDEVGDVVVFEQSIKSPFEYDEHELITPSAPISKLLSQSGAPRGILKTKSKSDIMDCDDEFLLEIAEFEEDVLEMTPKAKSRYLKKQKTIAEPEEDLNCISDNDNDDVSEDDKDRKVSKRKSRSKTDVSSRGSKSRRSSRSKSKTRSSRSKSELRDENDDGTMMLPREVFEHLFNFLKPEDLQICSRVCSRWKKMTDLRLRDPLLFKGKSIYGHFYSTRKCRDFVTHVQNAEARYFRPVEAYFYRTNNPQLRSIVDKHGSQFRSSIRHIESLKLEECSVKWKTLFMVLQSFSHIRILSDINSNHFSQTAAFSCQKNRESLKKEMARKEFTDFKDQMKSLRKLTIHRKTISKEVIIYISILAQGSRHLQELELRIGPWEISNNVNDQEFTKLLGNFVNQLKMLIEKNKKHLRKIKFVWLDTKFAGYFSTCVDVLASLRLNNLREISLEFDPRAMGGKNSGELREFIDYHFSKSLQQLRLAKMHLGEDWKSTAEFLDRMDIIPICCGGFDFKLIISDSTTPLNNNVAAAISKVIQMKVFQNFTTSIHFSIENEATKSISEMFTIDWPKKVKFPRVKSVLITFNPDILPRKSFNNFKAFNIYTIAKCFPNLTQLKISDRLIQHNQIFTRVLGRKKVINVSKASLENKDLLLIGEVLKKLKILKLWVNMSNIDDHGITGIHKDDISILKEDDVNFSWNNFENDVLHSFSDLKHLEELSLMGLGPYVTDLSAKFGFENLTKLKLLEICGTMKITKTGKAALKSKLKDHGNGTVVRIKRCVI